MGHFNNILTNCMGLEGSSSILVFRLEDNYLNKQKKKPQTVLRFDQRVKVHSHQGQYNDTNIALQFILNL